MPAMKTAGQSLRTAEHWHKSKAAFHARILSLCFRRIDQLDSINERLLVKHEIPFCRYLSDLQHQRQLFAQYAQLAKSWARQLAPAKTRRDSVHSRKVVTNPPVKLPTIPQRLGSFARVIGSILLMFVLSDVARYAAIRPESAVVKVQSKRALPMGTGAHWNVRLPHPSRLDDLMGRPD